MARPFESKKSPGYQSGPDPVPAPRKYDSDADYAHDATEATEAATEERADQRSEAATAKPAAPAPAAPPAAEPPAAEDQPAAGADLVLPVDLDELLGDGGG